MSDQILKAVIQLETEIEQQLQQEQQQADAWLAMARRGLQHELEQSRAELAKNNRLELDQAEQLLEFETEKLLQQEQDYVRCLEELEEQRLLEVLSRQITRILPGQCDDYQDG